MRDLLAYLHAVHLGADDKIAILAWRYVVESIR
jgi:hypothetical protein